MNKMVIEMEEIEEELWVNYRGDGMKTIDERVEKNDYVIIYHDYVKYLVKKSFIGIIWEIISDKLSNI